MLVNASELATTAKPEELSQITKKTPLPTQDLLFFDDIADFSDWLERIQVLEERLESQVEQELSNASANGPSKVWRISDLINEGLTMFREDLEEQFLSYDCHTFAYAVLEKAGCSVPRVKNGQNGVFRGQFGLPGTTREILDSPEGLAIQKVQRALTVAMYREGFNVDIPVMIKDYSKWYGDLRRSGVEESYMNQLLGEAEAPAVNSAREVFDVVSKERCSRWFLLSRGVPDKDFLDMHSMLCIGPTRDGQDLWIAHKAGIGERIEFKQLSLILSEYITGTMCKGEHDHIQLNLLGQSVSSILPKQ